MLALALILLSQFDPHAHHTRDSSRTGGRSLTGSQFAFFEFAPLNGRGMGDACACTTPTGARGEALTFTRSSSAMCNKGSSTTGILNGDLVLCSTNQPRVTSGGTGALGLLLETAKSNYVVRSQEFDNASWQKNGSAGRVPVVTANYGVAPDGTTTADRLELPACTGGAEYSRLIQGVSTFTTTTGSISVYLKSNTTSGSLEMALLTGFPAQSVTCTFNATTWTRCTLANKTVNVGAENIYIGYNGNGGPWAAADVLIWGAQGELGTYVTSYIPTVAATVSRSSDNQPTVANTVGARTAGSFANTIIPLHSPTGNYGVGSLDLAGGFDTMFHGASTPDLYVGGASKVTAGSPVWTVGAENRIAGYWGGGTVGIILNGTTTTAAASPTTGTITKYGLNCYSGGGCVDGIVKQFCYDPVATRCR